MKIFEDLNNKIAIVTGGYGYLGKSIASALAKENCKVYVLGRSKKRFLEAFENRKSIFFENVDVSNEEAIRLSINKIGKKEKVIDILVNNAYFGSTNHPEKMTSMEWRIGIEGGLNQYFDFITHAIPFLKKSKNGKIINISSMYGMVVPDLKLYEGREEFLNPPNYGTAKAGVIHLTKYYAMCLAQYNINVNAISPGPFPSKKVQNDIEFISRLKEKTKMKRTGKPEDLEGVILLLSSEASSFITGQNIAVDGGWTI